MLAGLYYEDGFGDIRRICCSRRRPDVIEDASVSDRSEHPPGSVDDTEPADSVHSGASTVVEVGFDGTIIKEDGEKVLDETVWEVDSPHGVLMPVVLDDGWVCREEHHHAAAHSGLALRERFSAPLALGIQLSIDEASAPLRIGFVGDLLQLHVEQCEDESYSVFWSWHASGIASSRVRRELGTAYVVRIVFEGGRVSVAVAGQVEFSSSLDGVGDEIRVTFDVDIQEHATARVRMRNVSAASAVFS